MDNKFHFNIKFLDDEAKERYNQNHNVIYDAVNHMAKNHVKDRSSIKSGYTLQLGTMNDKSLLGRFIYLENRLCERRWEYVINKETKLIV